MCFNLNFGIDVHKFLTNTLTILSRPIGYLRDPEGRITRLTDAICQLKNQSEDVKNNIRLAELDGQAPTHQVKNWLAKVAAIDAKVSKIQTDRRNGYCRWGINQRAAHILVEISELSKIKFDIVTTRLPPEGVQEVPVEPLTVTPTINSYLVKLQAYLQDDGSRIIGIWGMGGVGKTTLLGNLNNELCSSKPGQTPPMFDHVIWAVVSKEYNTEKLLEGITKKLGLPLHADKETQARLIKDFLKNKSFLLLLDDLWKQVELNDLGIPQLQGTGPTKRKMVFTTRSEEICAHMQAQRKMKLECLNDEEAWQLFKEKVGQETLQTNGGIPYLARKVAGECDGLPLALVVIGTAMSTKKTQHEWQNAITLLQKSQMDEIHGTADKILPKLKFSYDNLPDDIFRRCFLLCSLWPEDFSFKKTKLIECWMGHGLVDERNFDNINEAYDSGHALIGGLQGACLLEPGDDKDTKVKMHDVVRDLALWIALDYGEKPNRFFVGFDVNALQGEEERISLFGKRAIPSISGLPSNCSKLETLIINHKLSLTSVGTEFFLGTTALTYLDISMTGFKVLPQEIGRLVNLRYLNISYTGISRLPMELGNLCELRFLLLRKLERIIIPSGMLEKLVMLSVIDMTYTSCDNWKELSKVPGCLKGVGIVLESFEDLRQLAQFPNVRTWRLVLKNFVGLNEPLQLGSRIIRSSIQMLEIESIKSLQEVSMSSDGDDNSQLWDLSRLEILQFLRLPNLKKIVWRGVSPVKMLLSLTLLRIDKCHNLSNISWVIGLQCLKYLIVHNCKSMEQLVVDDNETMAFPSLKVLTLIKLKSLRVFGGSCTFPSLELLEVYHCPQMKALPFGMEMAGMKLKQICGGRQWWEELVMEANDRAAFQPYFKEDTHGTELQLVQSISLDTE